MEGNMQEYLTEKKAREKRLAVYTEKIQETVLNTSAETDCIGEICECFGKTY